MRQAAVIALFLVPLSLAGVGVTNLHSFSDGTVASAQEVNENFAALASAVSDLQAPVPAISSIDVQNGAAGQLVTVVGDNFVPGGMTATLGGEPLAISNLTSTSFTYASPLTPVGVAKHLVVENTATAESDTYLNAWTNTVGLPTGGTISTLLDGGVTYRLHAFLSTGLSQFSTSHDLVADVLLVAGGGSGGISHGDQDTGKGGGGAGGVLLAQAKAVAPGNYSLTIGAGGTGAPQGNNSGGAVGNDGSDTTGFGVTAQGGGGGGKSDGGALGRGRDGGSGGGGAARSPSFGGGSGTQNSPSGWTGYGTNGGSAIGNGNYGGGGGGGAGGPGDNAFDATVNRSRGGDGGIGFDASSWFGTTYGENGYFGGGGGGGTRSFDAIYGQSDGGLGGGGDGNCGHEGTNVQCNNVDAMPNTGGGGGGSAESPTPGQYCSDQAGNGGSGIVLIRYPILN